MLRRAVVAIAAAVLATTIGIAPGRATAASTYSGLAWWNYETGEVRTWITASNGVVLRDIHSDGAACGVADKNDGHLWAWYENPEWAFREFREGPLRSCYDCVVIAGIANIGGDHRPEIVKFSPKTGIVWGDPLDEPLDDDGFVIGRTTLNWWCSGSCANEWRPVGLGDLNGDGNQDLLWYRAISGELSAWLLNGNGTVLRTHPLSWRCDVASGCAQNWVPSAVGDLDSNGIPDLWWWNPTSGEVSVWLLDRTGYVIRAQSLDWRCGTGCASTWRPFGYRPVVF